MMKVLFYGWHVGCSESSSRLTRVEREREPGELGCHLFPDPTSVFLTAAQCMKNLAGETFHLVFLHARECFTC